MRSKKARTTNRRARSIERHPDIRSDQGKHYILSEEALAEKPARLRLDSILPYLEERIALKMPSDLKFLDSVLEYLNERMLKLGIIDENSSEVLIAIDEAI